ncbi:hypothetical protein ACFV0R_19090 [Streptomyces sp. NPDC059578]|uniref:tail completion protein gp17 n=1 Tax=Streptomyces sp. NPDC059578 TaxID=3346874 RepID=UPI0036BEDEB4
MTSPPPALEPAPDWPDITLVLIEGLRPLLAGVRVSDQVPPRVETVLPVVVVQAAPGGGVSRIDGTAALDLSVFAGTPSAAWALARRVRTAVHSLPGTSAGWRIDASTTGWPVEVPYGNPALCRVIGGCTITVRATDA